MKRFELGCVAEERDGLVRGGRRASVVALLKTTRREEGGRETWRSSSVEERSRAREKKKQVNLKTVPEAVLLFASREQIRNRFVTDTFR